MINEQIIKKSVDIVNLVDLTQVNLNRLSAIVNAILLTQVAIMTHLNELETLIKNKHEK